MQLISNLRHYYCPHIRCAGYTAHAYLDRWNRRSALGGATGRSPAEVPPNLREQIEALAKEANISLNKMRSAGAKEIYVAKLAAFRDVLALVDKSAAVWRSAQQ